MGTSAAAALTENSAFWTDGREHTNITGFSARPGSYAYASYDTTGNYEFGILRGHLHQWTARFHHNGYPELYARTLYQG